MNEAKSGWITISVFKLSPSLYFRLYAGANIGSMPLVTADTIDVVPVGAMVSKAQLRIPNSRIFDLIEGLSVLVNPDFKNSSASNLGNDPFSFASSMLASYALFLIKFIT